MTAIQEEQDSVVLERTLNAPAARVWKALTNADEMRDWYFDLKEFRPDVGFEFEFVVEHKGNKFHHLCRVTEATPPKKLAYTWRYAGQPGESIVAFELIPKEGQTLLKLTHNGLSSFPSTPEYARENFNAGWSAITADLATFVEKQS